MKDIHTPKWSSYFFEKGHLTGILHADGFSLKTIWKLRKAIKRFNPDILHAHYAGAWGLMGALTGFHPFVVTIHGSEILLTKGIKKWLVQWVLKKADLITTDGYHIEYKIKTEWGIPAEKIRHINFGVDAEKFKPGLSKIIPPVILYRIGPDAIYDRDTALAMLPILRRSGLHYTVCPIKDLSQDELIRFFQQATVYVSTAVSDAGLSSTTAEAMACGLPVIITDVGDNHFWVDPSFTFKPGDYKRLANLIMELLNDPKLRDSQGVMNRDIIIKSNNYAIEMAKMEQHYKAVLK